MHKELKHTVDLTPSTDAALLAKGHYTEQVRSKTLPLWFRTSARTCYRAGQQCSAFDQEDGDAERTYEMQVGQHSC